MLLEFLYLPFLFSLAYCAALDVAEEPCVLQDGNKIYNLNSLGASKDYSIRTPGNLDLKINICRPVVSEKWNLRDVDQPDNVGGFVRRGHGDFSIGQLNTTLALIPSQDPSEMPTLKLSYSQGSKCSSSDSNRASTVINFICATDSTQTQPRLVAQLPDGDEEQVCAWVFEWRTSAACAGSKGKGFGHFLFSVLSTIFILVILYLILGTLYNRYILKLSGASQIPQFSLESAKYHGTQLIFTVMDLYENLQQRVSSQRGDASQTNPVSHHTQSTHPNPNHPPPPQDDGFGFVRPNTKTAPRTNPISHQTTVLAQARTKESGTAEEREFMLGDDEDEEEPERTPVARTAGPPPPAADESGPEPAADGAQLRGRSGEDGEILKL